MWRTRGSPHHRVKESIMSEDNTDTNTNTNDSLISQVEGELKKSDRESAKAKLKDILKKKREAEKTIRSLDLEAAKIVDDFNNGLL